MAKEKKVKKKRTAGQIIGDIVIIVIIIGLLAAAGWLLYREFFPNNTPILKYSMTDKSNDKLDWNLLRQKNPEAVGWISIEGTNIDTPVVQTTDNDKYLNLNFNGESDIRGVPFVDYAYKYPGSRNCVIYGHSSMDSTVPVMFDELKKYVDEPEFIKKNGVIKYQQPEELGGDKQYQVFAVIVKESDFDYRRMEFYGEDEFLSYFYNIRLQSAVQNEDVVLEPGDEVMTLSTCFFGTGFEDGRLAVFAKRIKEN